MTWFEQAKEKLEKEANAAKLDRYGDVMKSAVLKKLKYFCGQDEEFAQAVVQGGTFAECMKAVGKKIKNSAIEDIVAYEEAVRFYFPGAGIVSTMRIDLCASVGGSEPAEEKTEKSGAVILNLTDYL